MNKERVAQVIWDHRRKAFVDVSTGKVAKVLEQLGDRVLLEKGNSYEELLSEGSANAYELEPIVLHDASGSRIARSITLYKAQWSDVA